MISYISHNEYNTPWLLNTRMKSYTQDLQVKIKFIQCCHFKKKIIEEFCFENGIELRT